MTPPAGRVSPAHEALGGESPGGVGESVPRPGGLGTGYEKILDAVRLAAARTADHATEPAAELS
ncbi:hypothetical protein [Streptomyces mayteni]